MKPSKMRPASLLGLAVAGFVATAWLMLGSPAALAGGGNSENAKLCQKNGWTTLYTRQGQAFTSQGDCVSYAAQGGQLITQAALVCLNDGWKTLGPDSSTPFASEQSCVDFVMGGGLPVARNGADISLSYNPSTSLITVANAGPLAATVTVRIEAIPNDFGCGAVYQYSPFDWILRNDTGTVFCQADFTTKQPIPSGGSLSSLRVCEAWPMGGYAAVWTSSQPDPDSTPGNLITTEDDYVSLPLIFPPTCP